MFKRTLVNLFLVFTILLTLGVSAVSGAPPAAEVLAQEEMTYTVKLGDNLWALAEKYLGSGPAYWAIVGATNAKYEEDTSFAHIENPNLIHPGQKLLIPGAVEPFKARYECSPQPVGPPENGILTMKIPGDGEGDPLGKSTWDAEMKINLTQGPPNPQTGIMVFTAANGDQLFGIYEGLGTSPDGPVSFQGTFQITGGTGSFEGVTGAGTYRGTADGSEGTLYFDGMLAR
jgi:hypothetical protein